MDQLTLLDFDNLAEEIKTLTQNILANRWQIAEKLFYIKDNWDDYKKQDDFPYKTFQQFIKHYYNWTRKESDYYIDAHKLKLLLEDKRKPVSLIDNMGISIADKIYQLSEIDECKAMEVVEENPHITRKQVEETIKETKREIKSKEGEKIKIEKTDIDFRLGDFSKVLDDIPDGSVDLILTDPPYAKDYLYLWIELSELAKRILKPNGFCICYSGKLYLNEVMQILDKNLNYYWCFCLTLSGANQIVHARNVLTEWKPILIYQNGFKKTETTFKDIICGSGRSKSNHEWEQSEDELESIIRNFSNEGGSILDPMAGSGTTLIASKKFNRKAIGVEINRKTYNIAKKRIKDELGKL